MILRNGHQMCWNRHLVFTLATHAIVLSLMYTTIIILALLRNNLHTITTLPQLIIIEHNVRAKISA